MNAMNSRGFSIVELMVSLIASLIVIGSVLAFTVATVQSNGENIRATRLQQELRTALALVTREIRRAGYDRNAMDGVGAGSLFPTGFAGIGFVDGDANNVDDDNCISIAYDRVGVGGNSTTPVAGEVKAFRRRVAGGRGLLEANVADATPNCGAVGGNWIPLTNPSYLNITDFRLEMNPVLVSGGINPTTGNTVNATVRTLGVTIRGVLVSDAAIARQVNDTIRVRADLITETPPAPGP